MVGPQRRDGIQILSGVLHHHHLLVGTGEGIALSHHLGLGPCAIGRVQRTGRTAVAIRLHHLAIGHIGQRSVGEHTGGTEILQNGKHQRHIRIRAGIRLAIGQTECRHLLFVQIRQRQLESHHLGRLGVDLGGARLPMVAGIAAAAKVRLLQAQPQRRLLVYAVEAHTLTLYLQVLRVVITQHTRQEVVHVDRWRLGRTVIRIARCQRNEGRAVDRLAHIDADQAMNSGGVLRKRLGHGGLPHRGVGTRRRALVVQAVLGLARLPACAQATRIELVGLLAARRGSLGDGRGIVVGHGVYLQAQSVGHCLLVAAEGVELLAQGGVLSLHAARTAVAVARRHSLHHPANLANVLGRATGQRAHVDGMRCVVRIRGVEDAH